MGLFDRLKQKKEIERLEATVRGNPSPKAYLELSERYISTGDIDKAFRLVDSGLRAFPKSNDLLQRLVSLRKRRNQEEIRELSGQIASSPSAQAYARLASLYREIDEEERCLDLLREAVDKFPAADSPHQILGEMRLERFRLDHYHRDGKLAIDHLEKAIERNETNYKALLALAKLLLEIGAVGHALKRIREIQAFAPSDPAVDEVLRAAEQCPRGQVEDVDELLRRVENQGRMIFPLAPPKDPRTRALARAIDYTADVEMAQRGLEQLAALPGFVAGSLTGGNGTIALHGGGEAFGPAVTDFVETVGRHVRRMDIGNLTQAQIDGAFGQVYLSRIDPFVLAILFTGTQDTGRVWSEMQSLFDECLIGQATGPRGASNEGT